MANKYSFLPWRKTRSYDILNSKGELVAECGGYDEPRINSKLIILSVNCHDELLAALEKILECETLEYACSIAEQAIKAAKGE